MAAPSARDVRSGLIHWFDAHRRDLPWRRTRDPYRILVAEYLLQRTRVASGAPYYERFLARFPDVRTLASASEDDVLRAWEGLGFYRRARNLHRAARAIVEGHGGRVPEGAAVLAELPGIGPYTAGAVASVAFGERVPAVDGNVGRVLARLYRIETDVTKGEGRERLRTLARQLVPPSRPGDFNQALMELGATVCTPRAPRCRDCPLERLCLARKAGVQASLPRLAPRRIPASARVGFGLVESDGRVLMVRRSAEGLLGGLWSLPGGEVDTGVDPRESLRAMIHKQAGIRVRVREEVSAIAHAFSHRRWAGAIYRCEPLDTFAPSEAARWLSPREARDLPLVKFQRQALERMRTAPRLDIFDGGRS